MNKYCITNDKEIIYSHLLEIKKLLERSYWANKRDVETIKLSIEHSVCYGILDVERDCLVAFARVITDYATMYYLTDVIVDEQYRGQGLGKQLVKSVTDSEILKGYGLLTTKDAQNLYSQYGFEECPELCMCKLKKN